ncbi:Phosphatidylglycerol/phosphatidylinositol transfer protein [Lasiodiplodia hormozganensis]|uniref:Phosphatidylglycerol/phosphatidylinositol transfer protein n=2 Tax=Lasiodiplodia TaxID=66739 RepID=A0A5N5DWB9_9PEZI|nr:Phosphatidylglycerol phosphatidylinositol transfer protein precursor [Lasiodiplodia theobromae]KAB2580454.1 Phosphatidylglycerol/phosphatidylinositol transfer protein [Lasiodiplodia theobromae]KAF4540143.1 Phosphatidylglycerol phosphatidylinositol transfer protein precursor [Lasiodiplodia theobromae]KAK0650579.1 Phosphatidylglycerol/phosphatidylinositol transfer protein [Lasiodiplodia hormozganensis]
MKLSTLLLAVASPLVVSASSNVLGSFLGQQEVISQDLKVPGENPLYFCEDPASNILTIDTADLDPNPPEAGNTLSIKASGTLSEKIEDGAKVRLQVKYGLITLIKQEASLCDYVKEVNLECPLEKGDLELTKDVDLPKEIPPGKYTVLADVFTKDSKKITCLTATVQFHR